MSILFVLLMFLLVLTITYFRGREERAPARVSPPAPRPHIRRELGLDIPVDYSFHPGHTWVMREGRESARVGIDSFTAYLLDKVDSIVVTAEQRWVRQGQKLLTLTVDGQSVDMLSPLEGVVTAVNQQVVKSPELLSRDPYHEGWVCTIKSPEMDTNLRNLVQGPMVAPWMQNNISRLSGMMAAADARFAQDGGTPLPGAWRALQPEMRRKIIAEFFLT
ncbi:MAG TPA: glycine cleavage system protein H [Terriglobales bacterium]|nr:glycine cleavage system protein H [Terriglobales bacterium]